MAVNVLKTKLYSHYGEEHQHYQLTSQFKQKTVVSQHGNAC